MRPVPISEDDTALFNANFTPRVAVTYQNHVKEIRRMVKQQGVGFWIRFVTSFRSHNERHRLMDGIVFSRAEAVFIDMLHLLTCGDNLNELTRLMSSLRAMQAAITANDYQVLMDPVLRVLMTCYDKPLDGLRLYFRFAAGLVVMFRRWRQVAWRSKKENDVLRPWEPPLHWQEMTPRDYSEWTFEGHLLGMYGPDVPRLLGLPPGLLCWLPDELRNGHVIYPPIAIEEVPLLQDITGRGRNRKKCRRRKNRQFDDSFSAYDTYSTNAAPSSGDSGVCLIEQSHDAVSVDAMGSQKDVSDINKDDSAVTLEKDPSSTVMVGINLVEGSTTINEKSTADMIESQRDRVDFEAATCVDKSRTPSQTDGILQEGSPVSEENVKLVCAISKNESKEVVGYMRTEDYVKDSDDYIEENFSVPYVSDYELCGIPDSISGDWKKCSRCTEDLFPRTHCYCSRVCPFLDWKFRPRNEHSLLSRLHEAGAGDSIAQNMQYYVWSDDCPADEERPDYLYVLECRSPGLVQSGQYVHPGGIPMLEQNYGSTYDQCLHIYRRDGPPRIMNAGNFRPNCCMEELNHLGRPSPWVESPGNFIHPSPIGYIDTPTMDYMGPTSEMRRRGQQNRRFRQRRGRQAPYLATIEECFDSTNITEMQTFTDTSSVAHNDTLVLSSNKKHWNHKQRPEATEPLKDETTVDDEKKSNISLTNETFSVTSADNIVAEENKPVSVDTPATSATSATSTSSATSNTIVSSPTSAAGSCIKDYALAVCGLLGRSGKGSEVKKKPENTEENVKVESVNSKASPLDIRNSRKYKGKVGKTAEDEGHGKTVKAASFKDIMRSTDKIKKFGGRTDCSVTDLGKSKVTKSRMTSKCVLSIDVAKDDKSAADNETSNNLSSHMGKDLTSHINVSKHSIPNNDEKVLENRRKWKSVWTRRRGTETRHPEEKAISESDGTKEREVNNRYNSETREGVPENVPDILRQVENSELKSFWKENYEAPKPQRKSRPRRDSKWRSNNQENSIGSDFIQNSNRVDVTPIAKLDIVPAVEPNDKESLLQEMKTLPPPVHPTATESCISEIGWYEETLAEDKDREKLGQLCRTDTGEQNICSQKKNKSRKWKRKQKNNKKAKEERNFTELINKEKTNDELSVKDYNRKENEAKSVYYNLQKKSKVDENNDQILHNMDHIMNSTTQKDNVSVNAYIISEMKKQQTNKGIIEEHIRIISKPLNELQKNMSQNTVEFSKQTVDYCKTILDEVLKHLPENTENSQANRQISGNISESLKEEKTQKKPDSNSQNKHCCKTVLEDSVHDISENQSDSLLATSEDQFNGVTTSADKTAGKENIRAEPVKDSTCESFGYKNKEYKTVIANKRKQACVIRTLNYVTGLKINFPFLSKRDLLRFCFTNGEAQRCFEVLFEKASKCGILPHTFPRNISLGVPQPPPYRRKKILLLRHCDNCNILEKTLGEYGECAQCKTVSIHPPRVYCNKMCQRIDWKHRHRAEHTRHSSEQNHREN